MGYLLDSRRDRGLGRLMAKAAVDAIRRTGIARTEELLTEALLNPELAKTLLMKASPANRPFIAQRLTSQLGTLAAVSGGQAANETQRRGSFLPPRVSFQLETKVPAIVAPQRGQLVPGGAFRQALP